MLCQINYTTHLTTTNWSGNKLSIRFVVCMATFCGVNFNFSKFTWILMSHSLYCLLSSAEVSSRDLWGICSHGIWWLFGDDVQVLTKLFPFSLSVRDASTLKNTNAKFHFNLLGVVSGVIMSHCRLLQIWYVFWLKALLSLNSVGFYFLCLLY